MATLVYAVYEMHVCLGREGGISGPSQDNFETKWYKSCKSVQIWIINQINVFAFTFNADISLRSCLSVRVTVHQFFGILHSTS